MHVQLPTIRWNPLPMLRSASECLKRCLVVGIRSADSAAPAEPNPPADARYERTEQPSSDHQPPAGVPDYARLVVQHTTELIALIDPQGNYCFATPSFARLGYAANDLIGRPIAALLHPDDAARFAATPAAQTLTLRLRTSAGEWRHLVGQIHTVAYAGETLHMLVARELPGVSAPADELRRTQRTLVLGALAAGMIHDLNNLLTIIAGNAEMAAEALPAGHPVQTDLAMISSVAAHAGSLTNQVSRYVSSPQNERRRIQLDALLREQSLLINRLAGPLVQVSFASDPDLWPINGVPGDLTEVLLSLIFGARAALPAGGQLLLSARNAPAAGETAAIGDAVVIEISIAAAAEYGRTVQAVAHLNAAGLLQHVQEISLTGCRRVIEAHGGMLQSADTVGNGAAWRMLLPRAA